MAEHSWAIVSARVGEVDLVPVGPPLTFSDSVLIQTSFSGVSPGTERWVAWDRFGWQAWRRPFVTGYQRSGVVTRLGREYKGPLEIGQRVAATSSLGWVGYEAAWGAHSSLAASAPHEVIDAEGIRDDLSALVVSAQVGVNAAQRITRPDGAHVLVIGDGVIGSSAALAARALGYRVLVVGRKTRRLGTLHRLGLATRHADALDSDDLKDFEPTAVVDTVQSASAFGSYIKALPDRHAEIIASGHSPSGAESWLDNETLQKREVTVQFISGWTPARLARTLQMIRQGDLPMEKLLGPIAATPASALATARIVSRGALTDATAAIDWRAVTAEMD